MSAFASAEQTDFSSLDAKLENFNLQGDIEIYDFDDNWEGGDDLNDDTFGGSGPVAQDFDFAGQTAMASGMPPRPDSSVNKMSQFQDSRPAKTTNALSSLDDDSLLGPARPAAASKRSQPATPSLGQQQQQQRRPLTVEELEAQMMQQQRPSAQRTASPQVPPQPTSADAPQQSGKVPKTLEEIEAEMMASARRGSPAPPMPVPQQQQQQPMPTTSAPFMPPHIMGLPLNNNNNVPPGYLPMQFPPGMITPEMIQRGMVNPEMLARGFPGPRHILPPAMQQQHQQHSRNVPPPPTALTAQQLQQVQQMMQLNKTPQNFPPLGAMPAGRHQTPVPMPPPPQGNISPGNMSVAQLQAHRMSLLSRPPTDETKAILAELEQLIVRAEARERLQHKLAAKWAEIAPYNNLMSQGEKDFITRIQIGQLLNSSGPGGEHDPLKDDFYFTVFSAIRSRNPHQKDVAAPSVGGSGNNNNEKRGERRRQHQAMQKMANQVQRIVNDARQKPKNSQVSLDGALGKIAFRAKSAPKPALQVSPSSHSDAVNATGPEAATLSEAIAAGAGGQTQTRAALTRRQALLALEQIYSCVLELEQIKRTQPQMAHYVSIAPESATDLDAVKQALQDGQGRYEELTKKLWEASKVGQPLEISNPHPFVSLLAPPKGKKLLPRILRHTSPDQTLTIFLLILATFQTLDVVQNARILDLPKPADPFSVEARSRQDVEFNSDSFLATIAPAFINHLSKQPLRVVAGLLGVMLDRNDMLAVGQSRAGIAILTAFLSRAHILKKLAGSAEAGEDQSKAATRDPSEVPPPSETDIAHWTNTFNLLFSRLSSHWPLLFPSTRATAALPFGAGQYLNGGAMGNAQQRPELDFEDESVWSFLAALAVNCDMAQQQTLVVQVRDKVMECISSKKWAAPEVAALKIRNVNLMLHALGLEASQLEG